MTGATTLSDALTVAGNTTLNGATTINDTLNVTGATTLNSLGVTTGATVGGTLGVTGATTLSDALTVAGNTTLNGATTINDTLNVTGDTTLKAATADSLTIAAGGPAITAAGIDMNNKTISGLAGGTIGNASTDVVTGGQIYDYFLAQSSGVRYFHANSEKADSVATGAESIAIGPNTESKGVSSLAAGDGAVTTENAKDAIALGTSAKTGTEGQADGEAAIAIGREAQASGKSTIAMGDGAKVASRHVTGSIAIGQAAEVSGGGSHNAIAVGAAARASAWSATAMGYGAQASGSSSLALGKSAEASGRRSIALGNSLASAGNAFAAGEGAKAESANSISLGVGAGQDTFGTTAGDRTSHIAIGTGAGQRVTGNQTTAIGFEAGQDVIGDDNIAIGSRAGVGVEGDKNIAIGFKANEAVGGIHRTTVIGGEAIGAGNDAVSIGYSAETEGTGSVAVGTDSRAEDGGVGLGHLAEASGQSVALGMNSKASIADARDSSDVFVKGYLTGDATERNVVSVGSSDANLYRRIVNVADGGQDHDAVNVGQLKSAQGKVATLIGGGVTVDDDGNYTKITIKDTDHNEYEFTTVVEAIGAISSGTVNILPPDAVQYDGNGRINNVARGVDDTDAVNFGQLKEEIDKKGVRYFSVNSELSTNQPNDMASGTNAMAIGPVATAQGRSALAIGHEASANSNEAVAVGYNVEARGENSSVLGSASHVYGDRGVAIGHTAISQGKNSIVMGTNAQADPKAGSTVDNAIVIGTDAEVTANDGVAIGHSALAADLRGVAQGFAAKALAADSQAYGSQATASGVSAQASGTNATASGESSQAYGTQSAASGDNAQASGTGARASGFNAIATGTDARGLATNGIAMGTDSVSGFVVSDPDDPLEVARNQNAIAIGNTAKATDRDSMAIGREAVADKEKAAAFGDDAEARAKKALAAGASARATGEESSAFGAGAEATASKALASGAGAKAQAASAAAYGEGADASAASALAAGAGAKASENNAVALGAGANAKHARSVALGDGAETAAPEGTSSMTVDKNTYSFAGDSPIGTVSVGTTTEKRTITNVAAGRVAADSTDAINGSQLFGTNQALDALAADLDTAGGSVATALGGGSYYNPDTHTVTADLTVNGNSYNNVQDALGYVGQGWKLTTNNKLDNLTNVLPGETVDFHEGKNIVVNNDDRKVTIATADVVAFDTVTVGATTIDKDDGITTNKVVVNHNGDAIDVGETLSKGITFDADDGTSTERKLGDTLKVAGDDNITTTASAGEIKVALNKDLDGLDSVKTKEINVGGGVLVVKPGSTVDKNTFTIHENTDINIGGNKITNVAAGTENNHAVNLGQLNELADTPLTFAGDTGADVERKLGEQLNIVGGALAAAPLTDRNIGVVADGDDTLTIKLAENVELGEDGSVTVGDDDTNAVLDQDGLAVTDGTGTTTVAAGSVTVSGGANSIVIDAAAGTIVGLTNRDLTDTTFGMVGRAATEEQLKIVNDTASAGWDIATSETPAKSNVAPGKQVDFLGDSNITIDHTQDVDGNVDVQVSLNENLDLGTDGSVTVGDADASSVLDQDGLVVTDDDGTTSVGAGTISVAGSGTGAPEVLIDGDSGTITGLTNVGLDGGDFATQGRAATEEQLQALHDLPLTFAGDTGADVERKLGEQLNIVGGALATAPLTDRNIGVVADGDDTLTIKLAESIDLGEDGSLKIGDSRLNNDGLRVKDDDDNVTRVAATGTTVKDDEGNRTATRANGLTVTADDGSRTRVRAGDIRVAGNTGEEIRLNGNKGIISGLTNQTIEYPAFANGSGRAATEEQLKQVNDTANAGWFISANGEGEQTDNNVGPEGVADFSNTDGNIVIDRTGTNLTFDLASNLTLGSEDPDGEDGSVTVTGKDGNKVEIDGATGTIGMTGANTSGTMTTIGVMPGDSSLAGSSITRIYYNDGKPGEDPVQVATMLDGLSFAGDTGTPVDRLLNQTLNIKGGATGNLTDGNIGVVADGNDLLEIKLAENIDLGSDGSLKIGDSRLNNDGLRVKDDDDNVTRVAATGTTVKDDEGNRTATRAKGVTVTDDKDNRTAVRSTGMTVTADDGSRTRVRAGDIRVAGNTGEEIRLNGNKGIISGLTNQTIEYPAFANGSGRAATEEQLKQVNDTANAGWFISANGEGEQTDNNVGPEGVADFSNTDGNIVIDRTGTNLTFDLAKDVKLDDDGSLTVGQTVVDNDGVKVGEHVTLHDEGLKVTDDDGNETNTTAKGVETKDDDGNVTTLAAIGTTVEDKDGNKTETTAKGVTVTDGDSTSSLAAGSLKLEDTVSGNTVILDAGTGHLTGLTNTVWDPDTIPVVIDRAATEGQLKQVHDIASAGWNATDEYGKEVNIGPDGTMNFASGNGNIKVDLHGVDDDGEVRVTLNKDIDLGDDGSLTIGKTKVDDDGVKVGDDVALHEGGLTVDDGAGNSTETTAGGTTVTGDDGSTTTVGAGTITVAGGGPGAPEVTIDGNKGTVAGLSNQELYHDDFADGTGRAATEEQLKALHDIPLTFGGDFGTDVDRKLGERLAVVGGASNAAHLTEGNIGVVANGQDRLEVKLNKDIDLGPDGSVQIGRTRVSDEGVRVGKDVHLGDRGLVINGGPSVTVDGIYAGGKRITGVAPGVLDDDAVNLGQLKGGLTNLDRQLTAKGLNFADQRGQSTHRNLGQTMQFVGADQNISTRVAGPGLMEIALNPNLVLESVVAEEVIAGDVIADQVTTNRVVAGEVVAGEVAADRVVAGEVQADQVQADSILAIDLSTENIYTDNVTINNGGPVINEGGIDMSGQRIVNVAPGVNSGDAVNMGQLQAVHNNLQGQIQDVRQDLRRTDRRLRAGVAAAMATASLPQAYLPGKSMMSVAGGTWNGESGMAVGYSGISDNGNWVFKVSGNASSRGDYGGAVGVGYQW